MILALTFLSFFFFRNASEKVRITIFIFLLIGIALFSYAATQVPPPPKRDVTTLAEGYDFIAKAASAKWSNGSKGLEFPGNRADSQGFAYYGSYEKLENNETSKSFLEMQPQWVSHGIIKGKYGLFRIPQNLKILCQVGFLVGAHGSDGVKFRIEFENQDDTGTQVLYEQFSKYDGQLDEFTVDLNSVTNKIGYIVLSVDALNSSGQDWAIWNRAIVTRE